MRPIIVKAYGSLYPAGGEAFRAVSAVLESWNLADTVELRGDLLRIAYEGEYFPADEVIAAVTPLLTEQSQGKLDIMDLENWRLRRLTFQGRHVGDRSASLNHALDSCSR